MYTKPPKHYSKKRGVQFAVKKTQRVYYAIFQFKKETSEWSYKPLLSKNDFFRKILFLCFDFKWMFFIAICNIIIFFTGTYTMFFEKGSAKHVYHFVEVVAYLFIIFDMIIGVIHKMVKKTAALSPYRPVPLVLMIINIFTVIFPLSLKLKPVPPMIYIEQGLVLIRTNLKVFQYFFMVTKAGTQHYLGSLLAKYVLVFALLTHTFATLWMISCLNCNKRYDNTYNWYQHSIVRMISGGVNYDNATTTKLNLSPSDRYTICLFYVLGTMTHTGFGGASINNDNEMLIIIVLALISLVILQACFLADYGMVKCDEDRVNFTVITRNRLILKHLEHNKTPIHLQEGIKSYFLKYLAKKMSQDEPTLFYQLPLALRSEVYLDKYWYALMKSFLFANGSDPIKLEIARVMKTAIYNTGEKIFTVGHQMSMMVFVAKGSITILSEEDLESSVLTLGMGSCIGSTNLIYNRISKVEIRAATYCIVYILKKSDLWRVLTKKCRSSEVAKVFHRLAHEKLQFAVKDINDRKENKLPKVMLAEVKAKMPLEMDWYKTVSVDMENAYVLSKMVDIRIFDRMFIRTTWPWRFQPNSELLKYWNYLVLSFLVLVAIFYPYFIAFCTNEDIPYAFKVLQMLVALVFPLDVFVEILTAIEHDDELETSISRMIDLRLTSWVFICDLIAAIPFGVLTIAADYYVDWVITRWMLRVLQLNRMLKVVKIPLSLIKVEKTFKFNVMMLRLIKYIMYVLFFNYLCSCYYYWMFCPDSVHCNPNSLVGYQWNEQSNLEKFVNIFYYTLSLLCTTESLGVANVYEMHISIGLSLIGVLLYTYIQSDFKATITRTYLSKDIYCAMIDGLMSYMDSYNTNKVTKHRIKEYLTLQWLYFSGVHEGVLLKDLSEILFQEIYNARFMDLLGETEIFGALEPEVLRALVIRCETHFLPPNEFIVYEGQMTKDVFIIEKGYCEVYCSTSRNVIKVLQPKDCFCLVEMLLEKPSYYTYRASTHVSIIKLDRYKILNEVFYEYTGLYQKIMGVITEFEDSLTVQRLFRTTRQLLDSSIPAEEFKSWYTFSKHKRDKRCKDYDDQIKSKSVRRICKYLLMRRTILPDGKFIVQYEKFHSFIIVLTALFFPLLNFYKLYWHPLFYASAILDLIGLADMYLRLHMCYYNHKGILVSHPKCTAKHYLKTSFAMDVLGMLPIEKILYFHEVLLYGEHNERWRFYLSFNRLIKLYRYKSIFYKKNIFVKTSLFRNIMYFVPIMLILLNTLSTIFMFFSTEIVDYGIKLVPGYWASDQLTLVQKPNPVFELHINCFFWVTLLTLNCNFASRFEDQLHITDVVYAICCILAGYFFFCFLLAIMSTTQSKVNIKLMKKQMHAKEIRNLMRADGVSRTLQRAILSYFEYHWRRTQGINAIKTVQLCHDALKEDWIIRFYKHILRLVPVFGDMWSQVAKMLGEHFEEVYFPEESVIIDHNDIISKVYIVRNGEVTVMDPCDQLLDVLPVGSMFGNIDNVKYTRSLVKIIVKHPVDLLSMDTEKMYKLLKNVPFVKVRLNRHICLVCISYVKAKRTIKDDQDMRERTLKELSNVQAHSKKWRQVGKIITSQYGEWFFMLCSYFSIYWIFFILAFRSEEHNRIYTAIFYYFDMIYLFEIITNFFMPRYTHFGNLMTRKQAIKWYLKKRFALNVFCVLPFEIVLIIFPHEYRSMKDFIRMNRLLKLVNIYVFFTKYYNNLNVNVLLMNTLGILAELTLFIHCSACVLYFVACPKHICKLGTWIYNPYMGLEHDLGCNTRYLCSLYYAISIFTQSGFPRFVPTSIPDRIVCTIVAIVGRFVLYILIGQVYIMAKHFTYTRVDFDYRFKILANFLSNSMISPWLSRKTLNYINSLWVYRRGKQAPQFMEVMPSYLKIAYKMRIYGQHVYNNPIFEDCHPDFLRQVVEKLRVEIYFKGDTILHQGETNDTMYFVHKGLIEVFENHENEIVVVDELWEGDTFGVVQGLYKCRPHNFGFRAISVTNIVALKLQDWEHLLIFFPASNFSIYNKFVVVDDAGDGSDDIVPPEHVKIKDEVEVVRNRDDVDSLHEMTDIL